MNAPDHPPDPLLRSLLDDTSAIARNAAAIARQKRRKRTTLQVATVSILAFISTFWIVAHRPHSPQSNNDVTVNVPKKLERPNATSGFVKVYSADDPQPEIASASADNEARQLLADLRGLPVVLIKDSAGRISEIHIIER